MNERMREGAQPDFSTLCHDDDVDDDDDDDVKKREAEEEEEKTVYTNVFANSKVR